MIVTILQLSERRYILVGTHTPRVGTHHRGVLFGRGFPESVSGRLREMADTDGTVEWADTSERLTAPLTWKEADLAYAILLAATGGALPEHSIPKSLEAKLTKGFWDEYYRRVSG